MLTKYVPGRSRQVLLGADGTPYEDGIFVFDFMLPSSFPADPPVRLGHAHCRACVVVVWPFTVSVRSTDLVRHLRAATRRRHIITPAAYALTRTCTATARCASAY